MKRHFIAVLLGIGTFALGATLATRYCSEKAEPAVAGPRIIAEQPHCRDNSSSFPGRSKPLDGLKRYKNGFFPEKAFDDGWRGADGTFDTWYGKNLQLMGEASLLDIKNEDTEVYRFLWLRSFHHPISVRLERVGYSFSLKSIELSGAGGYEPGHIWRTDNIEVSEEEWCKFTSLLDEARFWDESTVERNKRSVDGARWILEGVNDQRYHIVDRFSPDDGKFREACLYLLKLSHRDEKSLSGELY